ncbi:hypothetical protein [Sphingomonas beigongshangi]|uniref:hypothetical protein n=1 Tax=Sphingomonas beigongshangi TaxID=2782540 RepID=UPI00193C40F9|nr:hypothetical protein [Sphingomonas beigongshangi]
MNKIKGAVLPALQKAGQIALAIWEIPQVQSKLITWLIRIGVSSTIATLLPLIVDAVK